MTIITAILDFLLMTWVFWPVIISLPIIAFYNVTQAIHKNEIEIFAGVVITAIVGALAYKYPAIRGYFDGWRATIVVIGGYIVAGFLMSLYKWFSVLMEFRKRDVKKEITKIRAEHADDVMRAQHEKHKNSGYVREPDSVKSRVENAFENCHVEVNDENTITVFPNWKKYPIGTWWAYWPFFLLELPFDLIQRATNALFVWARHFYNGIAKNFAVKG